MLHFILGLIIVFIIGMIIRWAVKKKRPADPTQSQPDSKPSFCPSCNRRVEPGDAFCGNCGARLS